MKMRLTKAAHQAAERAMRAARGLGRAARSGCLEFGWTLEADRLAVAARRALWGGVPVPKAAVDAAVKLVADCGRAGRLAGLGLDPSEHAHDAERAVRHARLLASDAVAATHRGQCRNALRDLLEAKLELGKAQAHVAAGGRASYAQAAADVDTARLAVLRSCLRG